MLPRREKEKSIINIRFIYIRSLDPWEGTETAAIEKTMWSTFMSIV